MRPGFKRLAENRLLALLFLMVLLGACSSGPKSSVESPTINAHIAPLAEKDRAAYANSLVDLEKGNAKEAAASLAKVANTNPGYLDAWINLAIANYTIKRNDEAKRAIEHAHQLQPQSAEIDNIRGLISIEEGRYKDAEQLYLASLKLDSKNAMTHYNLALLYDVYYQDIAQAISHYESYLSLSSQKDEQTETWTEELKQMLLRRNSQ